MDAYDSVQPREVIPRSRKAKQNERTKNRQRKKKQFLKAAQVLKDGKDLTDLNNVQKRYLGQQYPARFPDWTHPLASSSGQGAVKSEVVNSESVEE